MQRLDYLARRLIHPAEALHRRLNELGQLAQRLDQARSKRMGTEQLRIALLNQRLVTPMHVIGREKQRLDALGMRTRRGLEGGFGQRRLNLERLASSLAHLNPEGVLARGYSIVQLQSGAVVQDAATLDTGDTVDIRFHRGHARARIDSTRED
jgi:exodeoxyribonuclease VII large subunit